MKTFEELLEDALSNGNVITKDLVLEVYKTYQQKKIPSYKFIPDNGELLGATNLAELLNNEVKDGWVLENMIGEAFAPLFLLKKYEN